MLVAGRAYVPLPAGDAAFWIGSGPYIRHSDWLGSSRFASTPSRTVYYDAAYAPFGQPYVESGTTDRNFTGMDQDTVAGLYDFPAREYNGNEGRWPSPDPAGLASVNPADPQTWNRYAYVRNSPLMMTDPSGMDPINILVSPPAIGCQQLPLYCMMSPSAPDNGLIEIPQPSNPAWCNPYILVGCGWPAGAGPSGPPPYACQYMLPGSCASGSPTVSGNQPQTPTQKKPPLNLHEDIVVVNHPPVQEPNACGATKDTAKGLDTVGAVTAVGGAASGAPINPVSDFLLLVGTGSGVAGFIMDAYTWFACGS